MAVALSAEPVVEPAPHSSESPTDPATQPAPAPNAGGKAAGIGVDARLPLGSTVTYSSVPDCTASEAAVGIAGAVATNGTVTVYVTQLQRSTGGGGNATDITVAALAQQWTNGQAIPGGNLQVVLERIVSQLADKTTPGNHGAGLVGAASIAGSPTTLPQGSIGDQLATLQAALNICARL